MQPWFEGGNKSKVPTKGWLLFSIFTMPIEILYFFTLSFQLRDLMCNLCRSFGHPVMIAGFHFFINFIMLNTNPNPLSHKEKNPLPQEVVEEDF